MNTTFCVGGGGKIRHRSPAGVWSDHSPSGLGANDKFWAVWGVSETEVYAIGENTSTSSPLWYKWDGASWDVWTNPPTIESGMTPIHIFGTSSDLIWIITDKFGYPYSRIYQWDGASWSTIFDGNYHRYGIFAPNTGNVYACGQLLYNYPSLYKYVSGTTWSSDSSITQYPIFNIYGSNSVLFCAEGSDYVWRGTFDSMVRDSVGSITFKYDVDGHGVNGIWSREGECWIPNITYGGDTQCRIAVYNGASWTITTLSSSNHGIYRAITGSSEDDVIIIAGDSSSICNAFVWDGASWTEESVGLSSFTPMAAWMFAPIILDPANPPSTTYDIETSKKYNRAFYFAHIEGFPYIWTSDENATDWWTEPTGFTFRSGLMMLPDFSEFSYSKQLDIFEGIEDEDSVDITICDDILHTLFAVKQQETDANRGYLETNDIGAGLDPNLVVDRDITGAPSGGGTIYLGNQTVTYTSKSGDTFSGVNRGRYAILDDDLEEVTWKPYTDWDEEMNIPLRVTTFPQRIEGRVLTIWRCYRHVDTGVPLAKSQSVIRFRGKITAYGMMNTPNGYDLHANSIITELNQDIMSRAPTANVDGYHISSGEIGKPQDDQLTEVRVQFCEQHIDMAQTKSGTNYQHAMECYSINGGGSWYRYRKFTISQIRYSDVDALIKAINDGFKALWDAGDTYAPWSCWRDQSGRIAVGYAPVGYGCYSVGSADPYNRAILQIPKGNTSTTSDYEIYCGVKGSIYGSYLWSALGFGSGDGEWIDVFDVTEDEYRHSFAKWTNETNSLYSGYVNTDSWGVDYPYQPVTLIGKEEAAQAWCRLDKPLYIPTDDDWGQVGSTSRFQPTLDDGSPFIIKVGDKAIYRASYIDVNGEFWLVDAWEDYKNPIASASPPEDTYLSVPESTLPENIPRVRQVYMPLDRKQITADQDNGDETTTEYTVNQYGICFTMIRLMVSTGTTGYNSTTYDLLPDGWGLGIPSQFIDIESFEDLYADLPVSALVRRWVFDEPTSFRDFIEAEAKTLGFLITVQNGKITAVPTHRKATNRSSQLTIDDSVRLLGKSGKWRTSPEGIFNVIKLRSDYDYLDGSFYSVDTFIDRASQVDTRVVNEVEVENKGLSSTVLKGADDKAVTAVRAIMHERLQEYSRESFEYSCEVNRKADGLMLGDIVRVTDAFVPNPMEGTIGIVGHLGRIIAIDFDEIRGRGTLTIRLSYDYDEKIDDDENSNAIFNIAEIAAGLMVTGFQTLIKVSIANSSVGNGFAVGEMVKLTNSASGFQWATIIGAINTDNTIEFEDEMPEARQAFSDGETILSYGSYAAIVAGSVPKTELRGGFLNTIYKVV